MQPSTEFTEHSKSRKQEPAREPEQSRIQQLASRLTRRREGMGRRHRIRRWAYWLLFFLILAAGYLLWQAHRPVPVTTTIVSYQRIGSAAQPILRSSGYVTYPRIATISARIQTPVSRLAFNIGDRIQAGAILAEFDRSELLSRRDVQQVGVRDLEATLQRMQNLYEGGAVSEASLQQARTELAAAQASLRLLNTQIDNSVIRAPFEGIVIDKLVEAGEVATQGVCRLADDSRTLVTVDINQEDIAQISMESSAVVTLDAYPETEYAAAIYEIMPAVDPAKNTIEVKTVLLAPDNRFKPNMSAKVFFTDEKVTANARLQAILTVDRSAVIEGKDGRNELMVVQDQVVKRCPVELGKPIGDQLIEVLSGVDANQRVVLDPGRYDIQPGDRVEIL
ncbi:efflux RND transporter periplasmic adaptor subunit [Fodinibius sediminis]|nr:efflux RND transporter periplasmic adaptor subunit [Fodinibius sediminis]